MSVIPSIQTFDVSKPRHNHAHDVQEHLNNGNKADARMTESEGSRLRKRSVRIAGHLTSVSMEEVFWKALNKIASGRSMSINALITEIDRTRDGNLSSALRVYVFENTREI